MIIVRRRVRFLLQLGLLNVMEIKDITRTPNPSFSSQLDLTDWTHHSKHPAVFCPVPGCHSVSLSVNFVRKGRFSVDSSWYLLPLCSEHSRATTPLEVCATYPLVPAKPVNSPPEELTALPA